MRVKESRTAKRATMIYNLHQGYKPEEVAKLHNVSLATVYNQYNSFKTEGIQGLPDKPKSGRPSKVTPEYMALLEKTLDSEPHEHGYAFTVWTIARLRQHLEQETDISLSRSRFQDLLSRLGYRYRRPKRDLGHKQDPTSREQVTEALDELKKQRHRRLPMTTGKRLYQHLVGVLNWDTEQVHCYPLDKLNSDGIISFFEWLLKDIYPSQPLVLVMDNAPWHHSLAVQAALSCFEERIMILWLPPYSPDLNPIERYWKHLKANACANFLY